MATSSEKYQLVLEAREAAAAKIKALNAQINALGGPAMVKSQREVNKLERELKLLNTSTDKSHPIFSRFTKGIAIGTIAANAAMRAFSALTTFIKGTFTAALESEKVWGDVKASLDRHRGSVETNIESVQKFADGLQSLTGISDEAIGQAFQRLHDSNIDAAHSMDLTRSAMDLAAAKGMDVVEVASLMGKSINSSTNALSRYGISIDKTLPKQEQMRQLQDKVNQMYGGAAAARMETTAGKLELMRQRMGDLQEAIGKIITQSGAFRGVLDLISEAAAYWSSFGANTNLDNIDTQIANITAEIKEQERIAKEYNELNWYEKVISGGTYAVETTDELRNQLIELQYQQQKMSDQSIKNMEAEKAAAAALSAERFAALKETALPAAALFPDEVTMATEAALWTENLRVIMKGAIGEKALIPTESILPPTPDIQAASANLNATIKSQISSDIISGQQAQWTAAFRSIGSSGMNALAGALASGRGKLSDIFRGIYEDFMALFIKQALASIVNMFIPGLGSLLGGIFDTPINDRMAMEQGAHFAHYFTQGALGGLNKGAGIMAGVIPKATNMMAPALAMPMAAASSGTTLNVTITGNVMSSDFIERQVAPTLRRLITNGRSDLSLQPENVTGGRNVRVY